MTKISLFVFVTIVLAATRISASSPGTCEPERCGSLYDCDGLMACVAGACTACASDGECGPGFTCESGQCHAGGAVLDCLTPSPACETTTAASECPSICEYGCRPDGSCHPPPPPETCRGICLSGIGTCTDNADCAGGLACVCGTCVD